MHELAAQPAVPALSIHDIGRKALPKKRHRQLEQGTASAHFRW
jgi:hypothetical protein